MVALIVAVIGYLRVHPVLHGQRTSRSSRRRAGLDRPRPDLRVPGLGRSRSAADRRGARPVRLPVRQTRPRAPPTSSSRGCIVRHHLGDHLGADLGSRVRRRHRLRHGPPRRRVPAGRRRPVRPPSSSRACCPTRSTRRSTFFVVFAILGALSRALRRRGSRRVRPPSGWRAHSGRSGADDAAFLANLAPPAPSPYHRLNPLTKAVVATVGSIGAFVIGGLPRAARDHRPRPGRARLVRRRRRPSRPGLVPAHAADRDLGRARLACSPGPARPSSSRSARSTRPLEGVDFAGQTLVRLFAISMSIGLFGLTTDPRAFVLDLERRGLSPRFAFVALATLEAVPAMVERAGVIQAQPAGPRPRHRGQPLGPRPRRRAAGRAGDPVLADRGRGAQPRARGPGVRAARTASPALADPGLALPSSSPAWRCCSLLIGSIVGRLTGAFPTTP